MIRLDRISNEIEGTRQVLRRHFRWVFPFLERKWRQKIAKKNKKNSVWWDWSVRMRRMRRRRKWRRPVGDDAWRHDAVRVLLSSFLSFFLSFFSFVPSRRRRRCRPFFLVLLFIYFFFGPSSLLSFSLSFLLSFSMVLLLLLLLLLLLWWWWLFLSSSFHFVLSLFLSFVLDFLPDVVVVVVVVACTFARVLRRRSTLPLPLRSLFLLFFFISIFLVSLCVFFYRVYRKKTLIFNRHFVIAF